MFLRVTFISFLFASTAAAEWRAEVVDAAAFPVEIVVEDRAPVSTISDAGLPDGLVATGARNIAAAWYEGPTRRYAHGILGDAIEAGSLVVQTPEGQRLVIDLPTDEVFEDRAPRLADLNGDGLDEVIAIRSSRAGGGGVAVYGLADGRLKQMSEVPVIGRSNRWLNIAAIADLGPAPGLEVALVETPHIGGTLRLFGWADGRLTLLDEDYGYSNHAIGSPEMRLSAMADLDGDGFVEVALPSADRRSLKITSMASGRIEVLAEVALPARIDKAIAYGNGGFVVGLASGQVGRVLDGE